MLAGIRVDCHLAGIDSHDLDMDAIAADAARCIARVVRMRVANATDDSFSVTVRPGLGPTEPVNDETVVLEGVKFSPLDAEPGLRPECRYEDRARYCKVCADLSMILP